MFLVVPAEKSLRKKATVLNALEAIRELQAVLHGAELAFRIWVVVRDVRAGRCRWRTKACRKSSTCSFFIAPA